MGETDSMIGTTKAMTIAIFITTSSQVMAGGINKFDSKAPEINAVSSKNIYDIERCLIHMDRISIPYVYRQPDRPNEVMLIWQSNGQTTVSRADLKKVDSGTHVRIWTASNEAHDCVGVTGKN